MDIKHQARSQDKWIHHKVQERILAIGCADTDKKRARATVNCTDKQERPRKQGQEAWVVPLRRSQCRGRLACLGPQIQANATPAWKRSQTVPTQRRCLKWDLRGERGTERRRKRKRREIRRKERSPYCDSKWSPRTILSIQTSTSVMRHTCNPNFTDCHFFLKHLLGDFFPACLLVVCKALLLLLTCHSTYSKD